MDEKAFWYFLKKVHERLTIIFEHKLRNKMELDDIDEALIKELYINFKDGDLFQPNELDDEMRQSTINFIKQIKFAKNDEVDYTQTEIMSD